jgi:large subunit ribosomal protein L29
MKYDEIKELTPTELLTRKRELREEIFNLRVQQQGGQLEKPHLIRTARRNIARLETALSAKTAATSTR